MVRHCWGFLQKLSLELRVCELLLCVLLEALATHINSPSWWHMGVGPILKYFIYQEPRGKGLREHLQGHTGVTHRDSLWTQAASECMFLTRPQDRSVVSLFFLYLKIVLGKKNKQSPLPKLKRTKTVLLPSLLPFSCQIFCTYLPILTKGNNW